VSLECVVTLRWPVGSPGEAAALVDELEGRLCPPGTEDDFGSLAGHLLEMVVREAIPATPLTAGPLSTEPVQHKPITKGLPNETVTMSCTCGRWEIGGRTLKFTKDLYREHLVEEAQ
jgi:hypothetical protein